MRTIVFIIIILFCNNAFASPKDDVLNVIHSYCKADFEGARLSSVTYPEAFKYVSWEDEPGWDIVTGISSYVITSVTISGAKAKAVVVYTVNREYPVNSNEVEDNSEQTVTFKLVYKNTSG